MEKENFQIATVLIEEKYGYGENEGIQLKGDVSHVRVNDSFEGWEILRREVKAPYICFNFEDEVPIATDKQLKDLKSGKVRMLLLEKQIRYKWALQYQNWYYGYDFKTMLSVLERDYPAYYKLAKEELFGANQYFEFAGMFSKKDFDKIFDWMCDVFSRCEKMIPVRRSNYQNRWREHLAPFLFMIYVKYWNVRLKYSFSWIGHLEKTPFESTKDGGDMPDTDSPKDKLTDYLSGLLSKGEVEKAAGYALDGLIGRSDMKDVCAIFKEYEAQRQLDALTSLDREWDIEKLLSARAEAKAAPVIKGRPKLLIFQWSSFGHNNIARAFESFGFECTCVGRNVEMNRVEEEFIEEINECMAGRSFDAAYSTNYLDLFARACYLRDIPYLAWNYDSPSFVDGRKYYKCPTTNIFCFDSSDLEAYKRAGVEQAYFLPLAVDVEHYDSIVCSSEEKDKYGSELSFVGQLYESQLTKAMNYLTDYKKAYLAALMDNQTDVYGYDFFSEVMIDKTLEWLNHPEFNRIVNTEAVKGISRDDAAFLVHPSSLWQLLNKQTTYKERLLLLTLLSKHHEVKLYSNDKSELLGDLKNCGTVDYYTQMPKVFKCTKINLNATLRSIQNGIPLRCIDVMGCGGCLLTNYQKDFGERFKDNENVLFYRDAGEALEKADFYLAHDTLREKVALSGYETVRKYYCYPVKIKEMLELAGLHDLVKACERMRGL